MASQYPSINDRSFDLLKKITNNTADLAGGQPAEIVDPAHGGTGVDNGTTTLNFGPGGTLAGGAFAPLASVADSQTGSSTTEVVTPAGLAGSSILPPYAFRNSWFNLYSLATGLTPAGAGATVAQKQLRIGIVGDSVANLKAAFINGSLQKAYGKIGAGPQGLTAVTAGDVIVPDGTTVAYDYSIFTTGNFWSVGVAGSVLWNDGGNPIACDTLKVYYIIEPTTANGGGTFKVQSSQDAGAFADEAGYTNVSASGSLSLGIITISKTQGNWRSKVVGLTGRVRFILPRYPSSSLNGVEVYRFDRGGIFLDPTGMNAINQGILSSILNDLAPTTYFFEMKEDPSTFAAGLATMHTKWDGAWTGADWIQIGTNPTISPPSTFTNADTITTNQQLRANAVSRGLIFIDGYSAQNAIIKGLTDYTSSDGTHPVQGVTAYGSSVILEVVPFFNNVFSRPASDIFTAGGIIAFGPALDVQLYRSAALTLRTNSSLTVDLALNVGTKLGVGGGAAPSGVQVGVFRNQFGDSRLLVETTQAGNVADILLSTLAGNIDLAIRNDSPATMAPNADLSIFRGSTYTGVNIGNNGIYGRRYTDVFSGGTTFTANKGIIPNNASRLTYALPTDVAPVGCKAGDEFVISGNTAGGWKISQQTGQTIRWGGLATTTGVTGFIQSNDRYATVTIRCTVAGVDFVIVSCTGSIDFDTATNVQLSNAAIRGTITNDAATAGNIGEIVSSVIAVGSAVSLTTATAANVTSISLTAGDWDVEGNVNFSGTASTSTATSAGISSTSATLPTDGSEVYSGVLTTIATAIDSVTLPRKRMSLSATTTVYLVGKVTFTAGTEAGFGSITARRVR